MVCPALDAGCVHRDFAAEPYGVRGRDYYIDREAFLESFDYDFYHAFIYNDSRSSSLGYFGLENFDGRLENTSPTSAGHICNLGVQRRATSSILIRTYGTDLLPWRQAERRKIRKSVMLAPLLRSNRSFIGNVRIQSLSLVQGQINL